MDIPEGVTWLLYVDVFGTIGVLTAFAVLFWKGQILSRPTVDRIVDAYKEQAKQVTDAFLSELKRIASSSEEAAQVLVSANAERDKDSLHAREKMMEVVSALTIQLTRIESQGNGKTRRARRT